ncbi:LacI family DNA-binding transcriptional regulator [Lacinutrix neustonica]|uniref:LacI family DNA-binding transcriptional regulator n=1 Tax=Lacinutrix neustonica TaxID=2980107 RepID=A0A9E8SE67_9FLAO|nr:LacI family DNA-binding transcriptional regulator [Lacinutrix neustonica]WAC01984.1 LacI family DNA-binding transcriptional regulator [Lacinutrix neustonica]
MITLKELAETLGVSISTVSKALNGSSEIGGKTIARVKAAAKEYNYKPNRVALSLKNSKTKTIGVIIPNILNHFFAKVLYGIERESAKQGYTIITCLSNEIYEKERQSLDLLANGSVDGFIMSISEETQKNNESSHFQDVLDQNIPILMFDRVAESINCDKVIIDDFQAAYKATQHLLNEGRQHIVLINNIEDLSVGKLRAQGCKQAIADAAYYKNDIIELKIDKINNLETDIDTLFVTQKGIDGIIAIDNLSGVIALNTAQKYGYAIPRDLSVIGFSDDNVLPFTNPKLSTVTQNSDSIGEASVQLLVNRIETKEPLEVLTKTIDFSLNLRGTTL